MVRLCLHSCRNYSLRPTGNRVRRAASNRGGGGGVKRQVGLSSRLSQRPPRSRFRALFGVLTPGKPGRLWALRVSSIASCYAVRISAFLATHTHRRRRQLHSHRGRTMLKTAGSLHRRLRKISGPSAPGTLTRGSPWRAEVDVVRPEAQTRRVAPISTRKAPIRAKTGAAREMFVE